MSGQTSWEEGVALFRAGQFSRAAERLREAVRAQPNRREPHYDYANALWRLGDAAGAERAFRAALKLDPAYVEAAANLATLLLEQTREEAADSVLRRVLRRRPEEAALWNNLGAVLLRRGRREEAWTAFAEAATRKPAMGEAWLNLLRLADPERDAAGALFAAEGALALAPDDPALLELRGRALFELKRYGEAELALKAALAAEPARLVATLYLASAQRFQRRFGEAIATLEAAARDNPASGRVRHDLANALRDAGRFAESEAMFREALALGRPPRLLSHYGAVLRDLGALDQSATVLEDSFAAEASPETEYNLSLTYLTQGRLGDGFARYESRFSRFKPKMPPTPEWMGEALGGRSLLVVAEQGLGDTIQFARYLAPLADRADRVTVQVQPALLGLLRRSFPGRSFASKASPHPPADRHTALLSLPLRLGAFETLAELCPYLAPDPAKVADWRARVDALSGRRVGLVWAGNAEFAADHLRSVPAEALAPLGAAEDVSFVSLQIGGTRKPDITLHDWTGDLRDFDDTAALVCALDLVIGVDTAVVHLAGALGRPVWLMNRFDACWRWQWETESGLWYPTLRQFRQPAPGDWASVVARIAASLAAP